MKGNRLYKCEKLCSRTAINDLFANGRSMVAYPIRAIVAIKPCDDDSATRFMITVPKKKIRTAVGRVLARRRIREAYRLNRPLLNTRLATIGSRANIAFLYMDKSIATYATIDGAMKTLLGKIATYAETHIPHEEKENSCDETD